MQFRDGPRHSMQSVLWRLSVFPDVFTVPFPFDNISILYLYKYFNAQIVQSCTSIFVYFYTCTTIAQVL